MVLPTLSVTFEAIRVLGESKKINGLGHVFCYVPININVACMDSIVFLGKEV